jgi:hypothetical protein
MKNLIFWCFFRCFLHIPRDQWVLKFPENYREALQSILNSFPVYTKMIRSLFNPLEIEYYLKNRFFTCFLWYSHKTCMVVIPVASNPYPWRVRVLVQAQDPAGIPVSSPK